MSMGTAAKIRLVKCPRCRQVLPETPNVPLYQCGGCGTVLQAKIQNQNSTSTTSSLPETDADDTDNGDCVSKDKEFSSSSHGTSRQCVQERPLDQNNRRDRIGSGNCSGDNLKGKNKPSEDESNASDEGSDDKFSGAKLEHNLSNDSQKIGSDENESGLCDDELFVGENLSNEDCNNGRHQNDSLTANVAQHGIADDDCSSDKVVYTENGELPQSLLVETNLEVEDNDEVSSFAAKGKAEADDSSGIDSTLKRSNQGKLVVPKGNTSTVATHQPVGESIPSDIFISSPNELLEKPQGTAHGGFYHGRSTDAFYTTDFVNPSSELSGTLIDLSKSPTTKSSRAYYDDGFSSYEGTDDQVPNRHKHASKNAYRAANHAVSDVRSRRERFPVGSNFEMQQNFKSSPLNLPERVRYSSKYSTLGQGDVLESRRLGHPGRHWRNLERDEYLSHHSFHTRESLAGYESGSTSNRLPSELYYNSNFPSQDKPGYTYQEKLKLLRMVYELQDQLKASLNDKANGRVSWKDHQIPMFYNDEVEPEKTFHNLAYPIYSGRIRDESNWSQQRKYSRIPFSAEAAINRHQVDHSLCCCPEDRKWSAQFPPSGLCRDKGFCRVHTHINSYGSCPSSPQQHVDSEFPMYIRGTKSDDQRHKDCEVRKYLREKHHLPKQHFRPLAGGAPFITCPCCSKLLQLPADFLLLKRRCHQLKCGGCLEVLKFSLLNKTHLIPYMPAAEAPPPHRRNFTSTSHVTDCPSISCSDDCGPVAPDKVYERKMSYDSFEHKDRERFLNGTPSKGKNPLETNESVGPSTSSSKSRIASSEIEEVPAAAGRGGGSPLHRLMGYSSAREVIYGCGPSEWPMVE